MLQVCVVLKALLDRHCFYWPLLRSIFAYKKKERGKKLMLPFSLEFQCAGTSHDL